MKFVEIHLDPKELSIIEIKDAVYLGDYKISLKFNDGTTKTIDFKSFLSHSHHPSIRKYLHEQRFKKFKIIDGNLNWNDYELIFPIADLYEGQLN